ncbi:peroxiredoxin [Lysobacter korlensis]|uniref:Thioredoxin peroxidase n=1 Tax=Lysobacter korlensis TaxID=553636 RepID=A0ABV6RME7_9GAMM
MHPPIGTRAPDFDLSSQYGETIQLSGYRGRAVALVFFPLAFSGACTTELRELRDNLGLFAVAGVELVGISVDSKASLRAWGEQERFGVRLLADFWPHGAVARRYGVFLEDRGYAARGTFLIDGSGIVRDSFVFPPGEGRPLSRYRAALDGLR